MARQDITNAESLLGVFKQDGVSSVPIPNDNIHPLHYGNVSIEPIEYINKNNLGFNEGNVIKYITRHASKNGAEDVRKAIQYCKYILKYQYGKDD